MSMTTRQDTIGAESKYFYDYDLQEFAEIIECTDDTIEFKYLKQDRIFCLSWFIFWNLNDKYSQVKFLDEQEYLFERLKRG